MEHSQVKVQHPIGTVLSGKEPKLTVRIIGRCNFRCPACSTFSSPERKGLLSIEDFRRILDILKEEHFHGVLNISGGEPTLHPHLNSVVSAASRELSKARIVVFTNGDWVEEVGWENHLRDLFCGENVLIRFSLDRQHAEGKARRQSNGSDMRMIESIEKERLKKARLFLKACLEENMIPGLNFDFAFKGAVPEANKYFSSLGEVPVYPIHFHRNPWKRPLEMGYLAVDLKEDGQPVVFLTLGHISKGEPLGGLEKLPLALKWNREALEPTG